MTITHEEIKRLMYEFERDKYWQQRQAEENAKYKALVDNMNMNIGGLGGAAAGMPGIGGGLGQQSYAPSKPPESKAMMPERHFKILKIENGWLLTYGKNVGDIAKHWFIEDLNKLGEVVQTQMVAEKLSE